MTTLKQLEDQKNIIAELKAKVKGLEDEVEDINKAAERMLKRWKLRHEREKEQLRRQMTQDLQTYEAEVEEILKRTKGMKARIDDFVKNDKKQRLQIEYQAALIRMLKKNREAPSSGNERTWQWPWACGRSENSHHSPSSPEIIF